MQRIVAMAKMFGVTGCPVYVFEDGNKIDMKVSTLSDMNVDILNFAQRYGIENVNIVGSPLITSKLKKELQELELVKYDMNTLNITLGKEVKTK